MVTLMTYESSGGARRRCDGTCHSAKHDECACICGGYYHGARNRPGGVDAAVRKPGAVLLAGILQAGILQRGDGVLKTIKFFKAKLAEADRA